MPCYHVLHDVLVGTPPISDDDIGAIPARNPVELWKHAFCKYFPQNSIRNKPQDDPSKDVQVTTFKWIVANISRAGTLP